MDLLTLGYLLLGGISGFVSGLIGAGAGVVIVPILAICGFGGNAPAASAVAVAMCSVLGGLQVMPAYARRLPPRAWVPGAVMAVSAFASAHAGVTLVSQIPRFAATLLLAFFVFLNLDLFARHERRERLQKLPPASEIGGVQPFMRFVVFGAATGLFGGMVGSAGGLMLLPLLVAYARMGVKEAVYACHLMMIGSSLSGLLGQHYFGSLNLEAGLPLGLGAVVGGYFGVLAIEVTSEDTIKLLTRVFLSELGIFLLAWSFIA